MGASSSTLYEETREARKERRNPNIDEWQLQKLEYVGHSVQHRGQLSKLCYPETDNKHVGNVRFSKKFRLGKGCDGTRVYLGLTQDGYEEATGTDYVYLILDLCEESLEKFVDNSTIHDLQKALPNILRQILNGLADLHSGSHPILHRDLKPNNVLRDVDGRFLIADFGISRVLKNGSKTHISKLNRGCQFWIAPEAVEEKDSNKARNEDLNKARNEDSKKGRYKKESDVYNAGMIAYYVATKGKHPFGIERHRLDNMLNGNPVGLDEIKDETLKDLLSWMLKLQPEERPSANEALKHPFLMSDDQKFEFLCKVGNLQSTKLNDPQSSIVQHLNIESLNWRSQMDNDVYKYLVNGRNYGSSWTECLRLIRNIGMHWNDRPQHLPQPEAFYKIGDHRAYFLKTFPSLPVKVHAAVRSNEELKYKLKLKDDLRIANYDIPSIGQDDLDLMPLYKLYSESPPFPRSKSSVSEEWKYIHESTKHKELLLKLIEYGRNPSVKVKVVGNVRVIFSDEFCIGKGSNETRVFLGLTKDGYGKAVKRISRDNYLEPAQHEKKTLNEFHAKKSKYVANYYFFEEDTATEYVYLILDLCEESLESFVKSSTLHDLQKALPEILRQILQGLADLHSGPNPILHRDLKPSNVLRDSQHNFLIADFGISRILKNDTTTYESSPNMGTEYWIAPESYIEEEDSVDKGRYKRESDIMNAGMVTYYVATKGKHPFGTKRHRLDNMLNGNPVGLEEIKDETLKDLLSWMLNLKPKDRPSATEALKHPFLMSDDEKFDLLCKVGNLQQIKTNDPQSSVVQQLNSKSEHWKSKMDCDVYDYLVNGRTYKSSWTECLRLIRNIDMHWNDRPRPLPQPEPFYKIGYHRAYFLKTFPSLPVRVHAAVRSNEELKDKPELIDLADLRYTRLTTEEIEKIGSKVGTDWNILGGLLEIPFNIRDEITVHDTIYPNPSAKAKEILVIFNEGKKFDRYVLKNCLEELKLDVDEILSPTNQSDGESQAFERIKSFSSLNKDTKATSCKVEKLVTSVGGNLMMEDVIFDIGPGCLEDTTMIKLVKVNNPSYIKSLLDLELLKSSIYHLQCLPNNLHFSKPAPLQININGDRAISREDNGSLKIVAIYGSYSNDKQKTTWKFLEDIDVNEKRILININTFSSYIFVTAISSYIPRILCHLNEFFYAYAYVFHRRSSKQEH
ncbi:uncharacterized protein LOC124449034 [Xenia sp. Carnegie-2017]|uniref:uncharacterized protein LOC124449034 n=1 Tax=Xenia sp. Carnegie-2017 TaxID=2897299 RepID=UPI001F03E020|nr:uncharacterized protein LOC124449034 [Xenia sp. Carnegie-2017]